MQRLALVGYLAFALLAVSLVNRINAQTQPIGGMIATSVTTGPTGPPSLFANGTVTAPSIGFASNSNTGWYLFSSGNLVQDIGGANIALWNSSGVVLQGTALLRWANGDALQSVDAALVRVAPGVIEVNTGTTGTRASLALAKVIATQTTAPTCTGNCGAATVTGSDTGFRVTTGATEMSNSFAIVFNGTYSGTNPACIAQLAGAAGGVASVGSVSSVATGATFNLTTIRASGQVYHVWCPGLSG